MVVCIDFALLLLLYDHVVGKWAINMLTTNVAEEKTNEQIAFE